MAVLDFKSGSDGMRVTTDKNRVYPCKLRIMTLSIHNPAHKQDKLKRRIATGGVYYIICLMYQRGYCFIRCIRSSITLSTSGSCLRSDAILSHAYITVE